MRRRKIEQVCKRDINFIWLLRGQKASDYNTIVRFRCERLAEIIDDLFNQLVRKLGELGEIRYENIFIDGTKIEANTNKYTFVWKKTTNKFEAKLQNKIRTIIDEINVNFKTEYSIPDSKIDVSFLEQILKFLSEKKKSENIEFVNGKGKRKTKIQRAIENLQDIINVS